MRHRNWTAGTLAMLLAAGCNTNPTMVANDPGGEDDHGHELFADLVLSADHVHTLSEVTYTVTVTDDHGDAVTDLAVVAVERLAAGDDTWRATELELQGSQWVGTYTFNSTGEYELRVSATETGASESQVLYQMPEALSVGRAHAEAAGYRVEFESFPGHVHEGDVATQRFWIMAAEKNEAGERPPVAGLTPQIACEQADGQHETHAAHEMEPGVYEAEHTFTAAGEFQAGLHFMGSEGHMAEIEFHYHVAGGH